MQNVYSDSDPARPEPPKIRKATGPIPRTSQKRTRGFLRDGAEEDDIFIVLEVLPKRSQNEQVLVPRGTGIKSQTPRWPEMKRKMKRMIRKKARNLLMS